ncbi:MAG: response regulator [Planctomycetes bacterium]|nr:response regulator [Planctomycetota bacterium]
MSASASVVLIADPDTSFSRALRDKLAASGAEPLTASSGAEAERLMESRPISLVLLNLELPDMEGEALLGQIRSRKAIADIPVLAISNQKRADAISGCLAMDADGYFEKPVDIDALAASILSELKRRPRGTSLALRDSLTGLPNREALGDLYRMTQATAQRYDRPLSLALIDLDGFGALNAAFGREGGDRLLQNVVRVISRSVRVSDILARWGGDEFVFLFPETGPAGAVRALRTAIEALQQREIRATDGRSFRLSFCAAVEPIMPGEKLDEAMADAIRRLEQAKAAGRPGEISAGEAESARRKQVLLAEDDEMIASLIRHRLEGLGIEMIHVRQGTQAVEAALENAVSLVLLDVRMPGMNGFDVLAQLRKSPGGARVPVILVTALGEEKDILRGFQLGANDYIVKPFSPLELSARVLRLLSAR